VGERRQESQQGAHREGERASKERPPCSGVPPRRPGQATEAPRLYCAPPPRFLVTRWHGAALTSLRAFVCMSSWSFLSRSRPMHVWTQVRQVWVDPRGTAGKGGSLGGQMDGVRPGSRVPFGGARGSTSRCAMRMRSITFKHYTIERLENRLAPKATARQHGTTRRSSVPALAVLRFRTRASAAKQAEGKDGERCRHGRRRGGLRHHQQCRRHGALHRHRPQAQGHLAVREPPGPWREHAQSAAGRRVRGTRTRDGRDWDGRARQESWLVEY